jgi:hypothetical protein
MMGKVLGIDKDSLWYPRQNHVVLIATNNT